MKMGKRFSRIFSLVAVIVILVTLLIPSGIVSARADKLLVSGTLKEINYITKIETSEPIDDNDSLFFVTEYDLVEIKYTGDLEGIALTESWLEGTLELVDGIAYINVTFETSGAFEGTLKGDRITAIITGSGEGTIRLDSSLIDIDENGDPYLLKGAIKGHLGGSMEVEGTGDSFIIEGSLKVTADNEQCSDLGSPRDYKGYILVE